MTTVVSRCKDENWRESLRSRCKKAYLSSCVVKNTMTGGSGKRTAVPLPRVPTAIEVALLPESNVFALERFEQRLVESLPWDLEALLSDIDTGLVSDGVRSVAEL